MVVVPQTAARARAGIGAVARALINGARVVGRLGRADVAPVGGVVVGTENATDGFNRRGYNATFMSADSLRSQIV